MSNKITQQNQQAIDTIRDILNDNSLSIDYINTLIDSNDVNIEKAITKHFNNVNKTSTSSNIKLSSVTSTPQQNNKLINTNSKANKSIHKTTAAAKSSTVKRRKTLTNHDTNQKSLNQFLVKKTNNSNQHNNSVTNNQINDIYNMLQQHATVKQENKQQNNTDDTQQQHRAPVQRAQRIDITSENSLLCYEISEIAANSIYNNNNNDNNNVLPELEPSTTPNRLSDNEDNVNDNDTFVIHNRRTDHDRLDIDADSHDISNTDSSIIDTHNNNTANIMPVVSKQQTSAISSNSPYEACWLRGDAVPYQHLSRTFYQLEQITNRKQMINLLTTMYWHILDLSPNSLYGAVMLTTNSIAPAYENMSLGVGGGILSSVVRSLTGISRKTLHDNWVIHGDLGIIAHKYSMKQSMLTQPKPLTVVTVFNSLLQISQLTGSKSQERKTAIVRKLCIACTEHEITYIIRTLEAELRIGAVISTVLTAVAKACVLHCHYFNQPINDHVCTYERVLQYESIIQLNSPIDKIVDTEQRIVAQQIIDGIRSIRSVYAEFPNMRDIIKTLTDNAHNIYNLTNILHLTVCVPIKPMLARMVKNWNEIFRLFDKEDFTAEIKYDGMRAQIHYQATNNNKQNNVKIYSRHMLDTTHMWPELVDVLKTAIQHNDSTITSFIIDVEIVAVEKQDNRNNNDNNNKSSYRILPFQELTKRKKGSMKSPNKPKSDDKSSNNMFKQVHDELSLLASVAHNSNDTQVNVMILVFDLLYLNNQSFMRQTLKDRRNTLHNTFNTITGKFEFAESIDILYDEWKHTDNNNYKPTIYNNTTSNTTDDKIQLSDDTIDNDIEAIVSGNEDEIGLEENTLNIASDSKKSNKQNVISQSNNTAKSTTINNNNDDSDDERYNADIDFLSESQQNVITTLQSFLVQQGTIRGEGLMLKSLSAIYEADVRTDKWIKIKKDYIGGIGAKDSFDCVVIGGYNGNGRKAGMISPWLLAVYDDDNNEYQSLCKVMSGFTDDQYKLFTDTYKTQHLLPVKPKHYNVRKSLTPDYWFDAVEVWEIRGADLTVSPKHTASIDLVVPDKGISLRFPRFVRVRNKHITDATTANQVAEFFQNQNIQHKITHKPG